MYQRQSSAASTAGLLGYYTDSAVQLLAVYFLAVLILKYFVFSGLIKSSGYNNIRYNIIIVVLI